MKKLIYIDNDNEKLAKEDVDNVKDNIERYFNLPSDIIDNMTIIPDFSRLSRDEMYRTLFDGNNVICTWSMYTSTHYNSLGQLITLLAGAGRNYVKGIIYIDGSGRLLEVLHNIIRESQHAYHIIQAIETNYILSLNTANKECGRIRMNFEGCDKECFELRPFDLFQQFTSDSTKLKGDLVFTHDYSDIEAGDTVYFRDGKDCKITDIGKDDCGRKTLISNGDIIATQYSEGHNMFTKPYFIAKRVK
jgi:hypothetical protein